MRLWPPRPSPREPRVRALAAVCGLWALLHGLAAQAAPSVLLLRADEPGDRWLAAERRTHDELRAMGLEVQEAHVDLEHHEDRVASWMAELGATTAVQLERGYEAGEARIWLLDARGQLHTQRLDLSLDGGEAATLAALRTVEAVHDGLLAAADEPSPSASPAPAHAPPPAPPAVVPAPVPAPDVAVEARPTPPAPRRPTAPPSLPPVDAGRHALAVHLALAGGPGSPGMLTGLDLTYRRQLPRIVSLQAGLLGAVSPGWQPQGPASVVIGLAGARLMLLVEPRRGRTLDPWVGLGGGAAAVGAIGRAPAPLRGVRDITAVAVLSASSGLAVELRPRLRLVIGVGIDLLLPPVVVRIAGREMARIGLPMLRGTLGLEWTWPARNRRS